MMGKSWLVNRYTLGLAIMLILIVFALTIGQIVMDGENPLSMGMTIWHLQDSGRDLLRVANETERYLLIQHPDWKERLAQNLNSIEGVSGGAATVWLLGEDAGNRLIFYQENKEDELAEVSFQYYLDKYVLVTYSPPNN